MPSSPFVEGDDLARADQHAAAVGAVDVDHRGTSRLARIARENARRRPVCESPIAPDWTLIGRLTAALDRSPHHRALRFKSQSGQDWPRMKVQPDRLATLLGSWAAGTGPLYERLARGIEGAIDRGELPPGTMLPTERDLARRLAVSRTTVVTAYGGLKDAGRLESRQGRGTWVAGVAEAAPARRAARSRPSSTPASSGASPAIIELTAACPPAPSVVRRRARETTGADIVRDIGGTGYLPAGLPALRERIAEHMSLAGLPTRPDEILVTTGAQQAIGLAAMLLGGAGPVGARRGGDLLRARSTSPAGSACGRWASRSTARASCPRRSRTCWSGCGRPSSTWSRPTRTPPGSVLSGGAAAAASPSCRRAIGCRSSRTSRCANLRLDRRAVCPAPIAAHAPDGSSITIGSVSKVLWAGLRVGWIRAARPVIERLHAPQDRRRHGQPDPVAAADRDPAAAHRRGARGAPRAR